MAQSPRQEPTRKQAGFFSIVPILAKLLWRYGRRLFSIDTLVALEKKHGAGSGERSVEENLLERALELNKHHYHYKADDLPSGRTMPSQPIELTSPVIIVKKGEGDERIS